MKQIENIFSNEKINNKNPCPNPSCQIIIDTREKQSLIASYLIEQKANIQFEKLEIADYLINNIAIERKTFSDFISSMLNKRLQEQLINLKKYPKHFLIIEKFDYNYSLEKINIHENAIKGILLSIATDFQIPIIFTQDEEDTASFLILLAKKQNKPKIEISLRPSKNSQSIKQQKQFILEGFPGIGPTTAKQLLENFHSLKEIFTATKEQLKSTTKLNNNKIEKFKQILEN